MIDDDEEVLHDPPVIFDALQRHRVEHVTVGGLAVGFWGHVRATVDSDIVIPANDPGNDERLRAALQALDARPLPLQTHQGVTARWEPGDDVQRWLSPNRCRRPGRHDHRCSGPAHVRCHVSTVTVHWIASSPTSVVRCISRRDAGS